MSKSYNPKIHHRRSIRLQGYDYSREGLYFITLCCQNRKHLFGTIRNGKILLSPAGEIVKEEWEKTPAIRPNTKLHEYIIMPNHFHAIIEIIFSAQSQSRESQSEKKESNLKGENKSRSTGELQFAPTEFAPTEFKSPSQTIGAIIRGFKGASTKRIKENYFSNLGSGKSIFAPKEPIKKSNSKEEKNSLSTGELQFAPTEFAPTTNFSPKDKIWQRDYYEHIIRNKKSYHRISNYIQNNPAQWEKDTFNR